MAILMSITSTRNGNMPPPVLRYLFLLAMIFMAASAHAATGTAGKQARDADKSTPQRLASRKTSQSLSHQEWLTEAQQLEKWQEWKALLEWGRLWHDADPGSAMAWYVQGRALGEMRQYPDAIGAYLQALRINPDDVYALNNLGNAYRQIGRFQDAFLAYREALRIYPDCARAWHNIGVTYYSLKGQAGVMEAMKLAESINPEIAAAWQDLMLKYSRASDESAVLDSVRVLARQHPDALNKLFETLLSRLGE